MTLKENMTRITVNIDKDKYEKVKEMAAEEGRSVSNYINYLIDKEIKKNHEK
jgi:predicted CopG family antitoxin